MPLVKDTSAVDAAAVAQATADAAAANTTATQETVVDAAAESTKSDPVLEKTVSDSIGADIKAAGDAVSEAIAAKAADAARVDDEAKAAAAGEGALEPEPEVKVAEKAADAYVESKAVQTANQSTAVSQRAASNTATLNELAAAGHEGLVLDFSSFPGVVLKDGEFQLTGSTRSFNAVTGFEGIVTGSREKFAMRVGGDDDGDVVFAQHAGEFDNLDLDCGKKVAEWKANGLNPELKKYLECYVMITEVHDEAAKDLVGELVVVQVSPTSVGRYSGYAATQKFKHSATPDAFVTLFSRGEKITSGKFPYYPWKFSFVQMA